MFERLFNSEISEPEWDELTLEDEQVLCSLHGRHVYGIIDPLHTSPFEPPEYECVRCGHIVVPPEPKPYINPEPFIVNTPYYTKPPSGVVVAATDTLGAEWISDKRPGRDG